MEKIRKILRAVSEKTGLPVNQPTNQRTNQPTNQPIITNNSDPIGPRWRQSNKEIVEKLHHHSWANMNLMQMFEGW